MYKLGLRQVDPQNLLHQDFAKSVLCIYVQSNSCEQKLKRSMCEFY